MSSVVIGCDRAHVAGSSDRYNRVDLASTGFFRLVPGSVALDNPCSRCAVDALLWLSVRWGYEGDWRFLLAGIALLLMIGLGGLIASEVW